MALSKVSLKIADRIIGFLDVASVKEEPVLPAWVHDRDVESHESLDLDRSYKLGRYVTVNKAWQLLIEKRTFSRIFVDTTRLAALAQILTPPRMAYVKAIDIGIALGDSLGRTHVNQKYSHHLACELSQILMALREHNWRFVPGSGLANISLLVFPSVRYSPPGSMKEHLGLVKLPHVDFVRQLVLVGPIKQDTRRHVWINSTTTLRPLLDALPSIERLILYPRNPMASSEPCTEQDMQDIIELYHQLPSELETVHTAFFGRIWPSCLGGSFIFPYSDIGKQWSGLVNLEIPETFMIALREVSRRTRNFEFRGRIDESFLSIQRKNPFSPAVAHWPRLQTMRLILTPLLGPSRSTYTYIPARGHGEIAELHINERVMNTFLFKVVHCIREMPELSRFQVEFFHAVHVIHRFEIRIEDSWCCASWASWPFFKPNTTVMESLQSIAEDRNVHMHFEFTELDRPVLSR
ncbi:hypothetical protein F4860DRAFT_510860 [Xylaria cubensis]|nr:hypothetical protein F4860DRAFT_510860 [Xylaria cubensis]